MSSKTELIKELEETPEALIQEALDFLQYIKDKQRKKAKAEKGKNPKSDIRSFLSYVESNPIFTASSIDIPNREERNAR